MLGAIWAQSRDGVIGDGTDMPWRLPEDLKFFKDTTMGAPVIMGRRTWESLFVRPLPGRENIILSRREPGDWSTGARVTTTLPDAGWIIGGGSVYAQALERCDIVVRTLIDVPLRDALGPNAVCAPELDSARWRLAEESGWLESESGHVTLWPKPQPTLRYRTQRFESLSDK